MAGVEPTSAGLEPAVRSAGLHPFKCVTIQLWFQAREYKRAAPFRKRLLNELGSHKSPSYAVEGTSLGSIWATIERLRLQCGRHDAPGDVRRSFGPSRVPVEPATISRGHNAWESAYTNAISIGTPFLVSVQDVSVHLHKCASDITRDIKKCGKRARTVQAMSATSTQRQEAACLCQGGCSSSRPVRRSRRRPKRESVETWQPYRPERPAHSILRAESMSSPGQGWLRDSALQRVLASSAASP